MKIKDIPLSDRPRERLINNGVSSLSNEELLAILLKTGTRDESSKMLASKILSSIKSIDKLKDMDIRQLNQIKGVGLAKACDILAAVELGRRVYSNLDTLCNYKMNNPIYVYEYYKKILGSKKQEHFYCVYLDNKKTIIADKLLYIGTVNYSVVHPREIFKQAYILSASAIICLHNHPSGDVIPSKEDIDLTNKLIKIGKLLGIDVIDHIIISSNNYYSFYENGDIV